jgi:peptidoglycan pentaglycine glycine transferase (the first glycine)
MVSELRLRGWLFSEDQVQFRNTVLIDVSGETDQMLARMKQKSRYNIRLAEKKSVVVRVGGIDDLDLLYRMYVETSVRDGFVIRNEDYYHMVWKTFIKSTNDNNQPIAEPLIAEVNGAAVAAIIVFYFAGKAYYLYGMSRGVHRDKMPNYLLQWEAIQRANARGCSVYDLWGAPDKFNEKDPMWGVFRFKEGLGGEVIRTIGAWDFSASSFWYKIYTRIIPLLLGMMRTRGRARTQNELE